jgi:hypothetical protein
LSWTPSVNHNLVRRATSMSKDELVEALTEAA